MDALVAQTENCMRSASQLRLKSNPYQITWVTSAQGYHKGGTLIPALQPCPSNDSRAPMPPQLTMYVYIYLLLQVLYWKRSFLEGRSYRTIAPLAPLEFSSERNGLGAQAGQQAGGVGPKRIVSTVCIHPPWGDPAAPRCTAGRGGGPVSTQVRK